MEVEGEQKVTVPKDVNKCSLLFGHPEVFVGNKTVATMFKGEEFQRRVRAIVMTRFTWFCNGIYIFYFKSCFRMLLIYHLLFHLSRLQNKIIS